MLTGMMKLMAGALVLTACASLPSRPREECATLTVHNQNFADVNVRLHSPSRRIGMVTGHTTKVFLLCDEVSRRPVFDLHAIGGGFDKQVTSTSSQINPGAMIILVIGPTPNLSRVIGNGFGPNGDETLAIYGLEWQIPRGIHIGIWSDVQWCMGLFKNEEVPDPIEDIRWGTAIALIDEADSTMAYGVTILRGHLSPSIIIEADYWLHPEVISHEVAHVLMNGGVEEDLPFECIMKIAGSSLPFRKASPDFFFGVPSIQIYENNSPKR